MARWLVTDAQVGHNLQRIREARGVSQADLAARLGKLGLPFHQQTILKVEKGQRPLRLAEAQAIATVLGVDLKLISAGEDEEVLLATDRAHDALTAARKAARAFYDAQAELRAALDKTPEDRIGDDDLTIAYNFVHTNLTDQLHSDQLQRQAREARARDSQ
jgi:transcriptional regulator with XRE-family HTH domain